MTTTRAELREEHPSLMRTIRPVLRNYQWIHIGLGLIGNVTFVVGSVLFLWDSTKFVATLLFILGSTGMLLGSIGQAIVKDWSSSSSS